MINAKNEIQYIIVSKLLDGMAQAGFLTADELSIAKQLAVEKYPPPLCGNSSGYSRQDVVMSALRKEVPEWPT